MVDQLSDRELLARLIAAEAGNQSPEGQLAVASVIMNRVAHGGYGQGLRGVMMRPGQFSPLNSVTGYAGGEQGVNFEAISPSEDIYAIADMVLAGRAPDPTGGATHFYNPSISTPAWGRERAGGEWVAIGDHIFGNADGRRGSGGDSVSTSNIDPARMAEFEARMAAAEGADPSNRGRAPAAAQVPEDSASYIERLADASAYLDLAGLSQPRQQLRPDPYVVRGRQGVGSAALSRMGLASLAQ